MKKNLCAELISVGTELLLGEIVDTNAAFISQRLREKGISVYRKNTIGDNVRRLSETIATSLERSDIVILCGGLGPTEDDVTREAIAAVLGEDLTIDDQLLAKLNEMFAVRKRRMAECNKKQALMIKSATALDNPVGTAFGWFVRKYDKFIVALPGPPYELQKMFIEQVEPLLPASGSVFFHRTIRTIGLGESDLAEIISDFTTLSNPGVGTYCRETGIDVRVAATAVDHKTASEIVTPVVNEIVSRLAKWFYGFDDETIVSAIARLLAQTGQTFGCMESLTGGRLSAEIAAHPDISSAYLGGITADSNDIKAKFGVDLEQIKKYGAASQESALEMARAIRHFLNCDWGISTTGVPGPEPFEGHPVGYAWVAVSGPETESAMNVNWTGERQLIQSRVSRRALRLFFSRLLEEKRAREIEQQRQK